MEVPATEVYNPWLAEWDNNLCDLCNKEDFRSLFGLPTWDDDFSGSGWTAGGGHCPRTFAYLRDHQSCAFCRLIYHGLKDADNWYHVEERAVWLTPDVFAWFLGVSKSHAHPKKIEKKVWLRIQRDCLGLDKPWDGENEVLTEQIAQVQLFARQPDCVTDPIWYETASRYKAKGYADIFDVSNFDCPDDKALFDAVHASACRGRWIPNEKADFEMLKNWLWVCDNFHDDQCRPQIQQDTALQSFPRRVIDVQRGRVIPAPAGCRYICLSYVWGGVRQLVLSNQTMNSLSKDGGIYEVYLDEDGHEIRMSKTVEDAVYAAQMLGEQYLWVDACCIQQDDPCGSKQEEINAMDVIYGQAKLTIVAAAGDSAISGLPGVREGSRNVLQHMEIVKNRPLIMSVCPTWELHLSSWERRAWTLQERALSRRLLVFTANQVYFSCRRTHFFEDTISELPTNDMHIKAFPDRYQDDDIYVADDRRNDLSYYQKLVQQITLRKISYPTDALNACEGLLSHYRRQTNMSDSRLAFGLPLAVFTAALCWSSLSHRPETRRKEFPSWSWAGWDNSAVYLDRNAVHIRSSMVQPAEADDSAEGRACQFVCPRALQDYDPKSSILKFEGFVIKLHVSRALKSWPRAHPAFKLTSPDNPEHCVGAINLDQVWRESQPDLLDFIIIGFVVHDNGEGRNPRYSYGVRLMCIEWIGDVAYRVQLAHDPPMNDRPFWTPPGEARQTIRNIIQVEPSPEGLQLIKLG